MRLTHLITDLDTGGAEKMLCRLASHLKLQGFDQHVICLIPEGVVGADLRALGIPVTSLGMQPGRPGVRAFFRLLQLLQRERPQVLQTWLYHADLLGLLAGGLARVPVILWNVRNSGMDFSRYRRLSGIVARACALLSRLPAGVVVNSEAGREDHIRLGYRPRLWKVIPNGVDTEFFRPDSERRRAVRADLKLDDRTPLVGMIARHDPMKGHMDFLQAAQEIVRRDPRVHFLLAGQHADQANPALNEEIRRRNLTDRIHLLGRREDVERIHASLDLLVSASLYGEGFSNVIAEAMACGVPCVVTDVGDSARIVGETGAVVPPGGPSALAEACLRFLQLPDEERKRRGEAARARAVSQFSIKAAFDEYRALYESLTAA